MIDIAAVISWKLPGAQWSLDGEGYDGLKWLDKAPKPTEEEIATWADEFVAAKSAAAYREKRAAEYAVLMGTDPANRDPIVTIGDQLDIILTELAARGEPATQEFADKLAVRDQIKALHPK